MRRAGRIAIEARRLRVLAERPELVHPDPAERAERALSWRDAPGPLHYLDFALVAGASPTHLFCARAVLHLSGPRRPGADLLDLLGWIGPERVVAIHFAVPEGRRERLRSDGAWAVNVDKLDEGVAERLARIEAMVAEAPSPWTPASVVATAREFLPPERAAAIREAVEHEREHVGPLAGAGR